MKRSTRTIAWQICALLAALLVASSGCSKSPGNDAVPVPITTPAEAQSQLQETFASAPVEVHNLAAAVSEGLRLADYDRAVQSLVTLNARKDLTAQQVMAVHESEVAMVSRLISAMQAGDANAKRAYEAFQKSKN